MTAWHFHNPVRINFGLNALDDLATLLDGRSYALVTYPDAAFELLQKRVTELAGPALVIIDSIEPNPSVSMLRKVCDQLRALPRLPDVIVALGGGSVIDTAKVLAAGHGQLDTMLAGMADSQIPTERALPIIAIPTTSGTGSEVTSWATVWDPDNDRKLSLSRDDLYPEAVIVDPYLVAGLPWQTTVSSGLDALSHALESLWNIHASPVTRSFAVQAAREIMAGLTRLKISLDDMEARSLMALGSLRAGLAFSNTRTALAHSISYPITLAHGIAHGMACSFCLPEVMHAAIGVDADCDAALADIFGDLATGPARLRAFLDSLDVPAHPDDFGIAPSQWRHIVEQAFDGDRGRNFIGSLSRFPFPDLAPA